jgi:hypothetical protein
VLKKLSNFIRRLVNFGSDLLSDNHSVSLKRFVSLLAFLLFALIVVVSLFRAIPDSNAGLLKNLGGYLAGIVGTGILGVAATDIFGKKDN